MEQWKPLGNFPGWSVSDFGQFKNDKTRRRLATRVNRQGFLMVGLMQDGVQQTRSAGILVAEAFVTRRHEWFDSIIHLNGDRGDCRAINLMWRTRPFAMRYHAMFKELPKRLSVRIPETGEYFGSLRELCTTYGLIERQAHMDLINQQPCFPYRWTIERAR